VKARKKRTAPCVCSDCGSECEVRVGDLYKAARLRCPKCGGPINRKRDLWSRPSPRNTAARQGGSGVAFEPTAQR
jgi:DNA-directed RNA polymerase subunit RPC12/RpoP